MQIGRGFVNNSPCSPQDEMENWQRLYNFQTLVTNIIDAGEFADTFKTKASSATAEGFLDEILNPPDEATFDSEAHSPVYWQVSGDNVLLFIDAAAGGDTYQVKVKSGGTSGFLDTKIHAATWEPTDTYSSGLHFIVLAADVSDAVRFYAPYAIIKTSSGDGTPGYLYDKFEPGTWNSSLHVQCLVDNLGGALRIFVTKESIVDAVGATPLGNVRYVKLTPATAPTAASYSSPEITAASDSGPEIVWNAGTGKWETTGATISYKWIYPELIYVPTGRFRVGPVLPAAADPTMLMLQTPSCATWEDT